MRSFRRATEGAVLVELKKGVSDRRAFKAKLESTLDGDGEVRNLAAAVAMKVTGLDPMVTKEKVIAESKKVCGVEPHGVNVFSPSQIQQVLVVSEVEYRVPETIFHEG